jgi:hypothetical protein
LAKVATIVKKKATEAQPKNLKGLWIDHSHLPTNIAKKVRKQPLQIKIASAPRTKKDAPHSRILALADVALGNKQAGNRRKAG